MPEGVPSSSELYKETQQIFIYFLATICLLVQISKSSRTRRISQLDICVPTETCTNFFLQPLPFSSFIFIQSLFANGSHGLETLSNNERIHGAVFGMDWYLSRASVNRPHPLSLYQSHFPTLHFLPQMSFGKVNLTQIHTHKKRSWEIEQLLRALSTQFSKVFKIQKNILLQLQQQIYLHPAVSLCYTISS